MSLQVTIAPGMPRPQAFIIGVAGGSASGKTSLCKQIDHMLHNKHVAIVSQDSFYRDLTKEELAKVSQHNFDEPSAFDWPLIVQTLRDLKDRKRVEIPHYDFCTHSRTRETTPLWNMDVVLFEGILSFHNIPDGLMDLKIFVETDADTCLARRVYRDMKERGRSLDSVLTQYETFVKPSFDQYVTPQRRQADVIIPWGDYSSNVFGDDGSWKERTYPAITMIAEHILNRLSTVTPSPSPALTPSSSSSSLPGPLPDSH
eukprot:m51a1_g6631 putative phosphoribulokinase uridine kinase family protein (258) ;mRNA; f:70317-71572